MKIQKVFFAKGYGGFFWDDQAAIKKGLKRDGFIYKGLPSTPGFDAVRMPSEAISIILVLEDGQIAYGDAVSVQYSGISGRDPVFRASQFIPLCQKFVNPILEGREIGKFRDFSEYFDTATAEIENIHCAIKYGVTQAILDAVAKSRKKTMAEVICEEYGLDLPKDPVPVFIQTGDDFFESVDKAILRKVAAFPHYLINNFEKLDKMPELLRFAKNRIQLLANKEYSPFLHYDIYGMLGLKYGDNIDRILLEVERWVSLVSPYKLVIEAPFIMGTREETIEVTRELIERKKNKGVEVTICVDEWFNSKDAIARAISLGAAEMVQIKTPAMGSLIHTIDTIIHCKKSGVKAYLGGSCCETERSAQITAHVGLATRPFQMLAKPGMGTDEGFQIVMNEMLRTLVLIGQQRRLSERDTQ